MVPLSLSLLLEPSILADDLSLAELVIRPRCPIEWFAKEAGLEQLEDRVNEPYLRSRTARDGATELAEDRERLTALIQPGSSTRWLDRSQHWFCALISIPASGPRLPSVLAARSGSTLCAHGPGLAGP